MRQDIQILPDNRLFPTVMNINQGQNKLDTALYSMENYVVNEVDLSTCDWYAVLMGVYGLDEVKLTHEVDEGVLKVRWDLNNYVTNIGQTLTYQIVAKNSEAAVYYTNKGIILNSQSIHADEFIVSNYPSILRQWEEYMKDLGDSANLKAYVVMNLGEYIPVNERVEGKFYINRLNDVDYQCVIEDSNGNIIIDDSSANKNLANTGMITNCLLEIPQDIKLELNEGVLTLKSGSKVYVPNGVNTFDKIEIMGDVIKADLPANITTYYIYYIPMQNYLSASANMSTGTTTENGSVLYNPDTNIIKYTDDLGVTNPYNVSFPLCKINVIDGVHTIVQVFNGFGYMDSILFSLPNVVGLSSQGRVENGRYKNRILENGKVSVITIDENWESNLHCFYSEQSLSIASNYIVSEEKPLENECIWRKPSENKMYRIYGGEIAAANVVYLGEFTHELGKITNFDVPQVANLDKSEVATPTTYGLMRVAAPEDEIDCSCNDASITPANLYDLSNYRRANTEYQVDDKVGCPYHHNLQLKCIEAGTTSSEALNTKGTLLPETTITDGTVVWEVEELGTGGNVVKSVNGITPDIDGNVEVTGLPAQGGNKGKYLTTDGTTASWVDIVSSTITYW